MTTGINYLDEQLSPIAMRCSFKGCPCRVGCWHLKRAHRMSCNPNFPENVRKAYAGGPPVLIQKRLEMPLHWKKPRRIGVQFMGDLFDEQVPFDWAHKIFNIAFASPKEHQFFFLTKQVKRMLEAVTSWKDFFGGQLQSKRFYWGVSITGPDDLWMVEELLRIPGRKWISYEPALERVWFGPNLFQFDWLVLGCQSGPKRVPMPLEWAYSVVEQCQAAGVPPWVKQISMPRFHAGWGECVYDVVHDINLFPEALKVRQLP